MNNKKRIIIAFATSVGFMMCHGAYAQRALAPCGPTLEHKLIYAMQGLGPHALISIL